MKALLLLLLMALSAFGQQGLRDPAFLQLISVPASTNATPWTPLSLGTNLVLWVNPDETNKMALSGTNITLLTNAVPGSTNVLTATSDPALFEFNGKFVIDYDSGDFFSFGAIYLTSAIPSSIGFYHVEQTGAQTAAQDSPVTMIGVASSGQRISLTSVNTNFRLSSRAQATTDPADPVLAMTGSNAVTATYSGSGNNSGFLLYMDGSTNSFFTVSQTVSYTGETGNRINSQSPMTVRARRMGQMIYVRGVMDVTTIQKWEGYIHHYYGTTDILPAGHPFKTVPPLE